MTRPAQATRYSKLGAILWLCCAQFFLAEHYASRTAVEADGPGTYSFVRDTISALGTLHTAMASPTLAAPRHAWMNASFLLQGLLIAGGALLVRRFFPPARAYTAVLGLSFFSGAGVFVVGLHPLTFVHDADSVHRLGAAFHFVGGTFAMLLLGVLLLRDRPWRRSRPIASLCIAIGVPSLVTTALLGMPNSSIWQTLGWQEGAVERVVGYGVPLWFVIMGAILLTRGKKPNPA